MKRTGPFLFAWFLADESLQLVGKFLGAKPDRAPTDISVWTNRFAKHRHNILMLHHPKYLFFDDPDAARWDRALRATDINVVEPAVVRESPHAGRSASSPDDSRGPPLHRGGRSAQAFRFVARSRGYGAGHATMRRRT